MSNSVTSIGHTQNNFPKWVVIAILAIVVGVLGIGIYIGYKEIKANQTKGASAEAISNAEILTKVTMLTEVPYDEIPVIATVKDVEKLKNQMFFSRAQIGDKLLIYNKARRALLYRPHNNKIIETMSIKLDAQGDIKPEDSVESIITPVKINIYNGTETPGLASALSTKLETGVENIMIEIVNIGNAKSPYEKTLVVNNKELAPEIVTKIATAIDADISALPSGEDTADADVLIFIGKDYTN